MTGQDLIDTIKEFITDELKSETGNDLQITEERARELISDAEDHLIDSLEDSGADF